MNYISYTSLAIFSNGSNQFYRCLNKLLTKNYKRKFLYFLHKTNFPSCLHNSAKKETSQYTRKTAIFSESSFSHSKLIDLLKVCGSVSEQIKEFDSYVKLTDEDIAHRITVCRNIESIFKSSFSNCSLLQIGSSVTRLGVAGCDLDLSLQLSDDLHKSVQTNAISNDDVRSGKFSIADFPILTPYQQLLVLQKLLKDSGIIATVIRGYHPILNFRYDGLACDLSINNRNALNGTNFMKLCTNLDCRVAPLFRLIIYQARRYKLVGGPSKFKSYSFFLLVVYFLQTRNPPILPSVKEMFCKTENLDNWSYDTTQYEKSFSQSTNTESLENLLCQFFFFYSNFDFSYAICPLEANFLNLKTLISKHPTFEENTISIQDPVNIGYNTTSGIKYKYCKAFRNVILSSYGSFLENSLERNKNTSWGITALLDDIASSKNIKVVVPLKKLNCETECFSVAASKVFKLLKDGLLFQCELLQPSFSSLNQHEAVKSTAFNLTNFNLENHVTIDHKQSNDNKEMLSNQKENICNVNFAELQCFRVSCTICDTWRGRSNYCKRSDESEDSFLKTEQEISKEILSKSKPKESKKDLHLLCECIGFYENDNTYLLVNIKSVNRKVSIPKLGVVIKEYIIRYASKYL